MTRGRPFEPGNKLGRGRPRGSKNKSTSVSRRLLEEHEKLLIGKNIAEALKGNTKCLLWCLTELSRGTPRVTKLKLGPIKNIDDILKAFTVVLSALANNKCTDARSQALCAMLAEMAKMIDAKDLPRLEELEALAKKLNGQ